MKKLAALFLALAMTVALAACGNSATPGSSAPENDTAPTSSEGSGADDAASSTEDGEAQPAAEGDFTPIDCDPLEISFSTTYNQTETGGQVIQQWIDYLAEYSNGNITVDPYWGGTLYGDVDVLDGLSSGAINMTTLGHMPHLNTLVYLNFPSFAPGGTEAALDYFTTIMFENEETASLVQQEAADNGIIYLNVLPGGANVFCTTYEFTDLDSLVSNSKSFGNIDATVFEALGFQVTAIGPADGYDAMQRGLIDSTQMGLTPLVSMQYYDIADYWALDGTYAAGNFISANLDWWNSLSEDQQSIIRAASDAVQAWSCAEFEDEIETGLSTIEAETGNPIVELSDEDIDRIWAANFEAKAESALSIAEANGKTEGMVKILELAAELTGYDWSYQG